MADKLEKKQARIERVTSMFEKYHRLILVTADNVGSSHMQQIRIALRGKAHMVMGKNTLIRKALREVVKKNKQLAVLIPQIRYNVGLVFVPEENDISEVRQVILDMTVPATAKAGAVAPCDVIIPAGPTTLPPTKTSFLQVLNINSKINKGAVEILADVHLIKEGTKVGNSEAALLHMLDIRPFRYGLKTTQVYDHGALYNAKFLDVTAEDVLETFKAGIQQIAAISLALHIPSVAAFPHVVVNAYKTVLGLALATDFSYEHADKVREILANPTAFAPVAAAVATPVAAAAAKDEEPESDPDEGMFGLFD